MSLTNKKFLELVTRAKQAITQEFKIETTANVELCLENEVISLIVKDAQNRNLSESEIESIKLKIPFLHGIYIKHSNTAYVILGRGDNLPIIIHELLHSVQLCNPHRHNILDYISFKLTKDARFIDPLLIREWEEIERTHTWENIKQRIFMTGDCEDFATM